ncbi:MAG: OmpA family protein [Verrucomicrobiota bacterium]
MNSKVLLASITFFGLLGFSSIGISQETTAELIEKLKGQAASEPEKQAEGTRGEAGRLRGLSESGTSNFRSLVAPSESAPTAVPERQTETRAVTFSQEIPPEVQLAAGEKAVSVKTTPPADATDGKEFEVTYTVDPQSKVTRDNIFFRQGNAEFADDGSVAVLVQLAEALKSPELADFRYVVEGHASAEGSDYTNLFLSQNRAARIVSVLTRLGVPEGRLIPVGHGETKAKFEANEAEALRKLDRRVEIYRIETGS